MPSDWGCRCVPARPVAPIWCELDATARSSARPVPPRKCRPCLAAGGDPGPRPGMTAVLVPVYVPVRSMSPSTSLSMSSGAGCTAPTPASGTYTAGSGAHPLWAIGRAAGGGGRALIELAESDPARSPSRASPRCPRRCRPPVATFFWPSCAITWAAICGPLSSSASSIAASCNSGRQPVTGG